MNQILKKILIFSIISLSFIALLYYCSKKIDKKRKEDSEINEKLEQGTCIFDRVNLENLFINYNDKSFKSILNLDSLKLKFSEQLSKITINNTDTVYAIKTIRIDNTIFTFYQKANLAAIKSIEFDFSSQFNFTINNNIVFTPEYKLEDFKVQYPKSYVCKLNHATSWNKEQYALRIDNSNFESKFKCIVLYFNDTENLVYIEFHYDFENNE